MHFQKPTDLDLHCLLRQGMSCSAREGLKIQSEFGKYFIHILSKIENFTWSSKGDISLLRKR